jgi:FAD/FMN-containing dehydrogenase
MRSPHSETELLAYITSARASGNKLRVHGARHSVAPAIGTGEPNGLELSLSHLQTVRFESDSLVTVGAGVRMHADPAAEGGEIRFDQSLAGALERRGRGLHNNKAPVC